MSRLRRRISSAHLIALAALFVSLGGTSFAALTITGKNVKNSSLTGKDVRNSSLTGSDVKNNSLSGPDVKNVKGGDISNGTIQDADVAGDALTGRVIKESSLGKIPSATTADHAATADRATKTADSDALGGIAAGAYVSGVRQAQADSANDSSSPKTFSAKCALGETAIGGGALISGGTNTDRKALRQSFPFQAFRILGNRFPAGYTAEVAEIDADPASWTLSVRVICAKT